MKILVICGDLWHPAEVIRRGFSDLKNPEFEFDFINDAKDILTCDMLKAYDLVITCKGDSLAECNTSAPWFEDGITAVMPSDFKQYIENGGGFMVFHAGNTFNKDWRADMVEIIGNNFTGHPPQCDVSVQIVNKEHPIMNGVNEFTERDEHYCLELLVDDATLLFNTYSESAGVQPGGYVREIGKGRVCVLTPGHNCRVILNPEYKRLLTNAIHWTARK